jgi:hypothetical protein
MSNAASTAVLAQGVPTYVTEQLLHILRRPHISHVAQELLPQLRVLNKGRYLRRWARRLREAGIFPEDAMIVSRTSFGVDEEAESFGVETILTTDYALKARYEQRFPLISRRFQRMTSHLLEPYRSAALPAILTPEEMLGMLSS